MKFMGSYKINTDISEHSFDILFATECKYSQTVGLKPLPKNEHEEALMNDSENAYVATNPLGLQRRFTLFTSYHAMILIAPSCPENCHPPLYSNGKPQHSVCVPIICLNSVAQPPRCQSCIGHHASNSRTFSRSVYVTTIPLCNSSQH